MAAVAASDVGVNVVWSFVRLKHVNRVPIHEALVCALCLLRESTTPSHHARALKALGTLGYWRSAWAAYNLVKERGSSMGVVSEVRQMVLSATLNAMAKAGQWRACEAVVKEQEELTVSSHEDRDHGCVDSDSKAKAAVQSLSGRPFLLSVDCCNAVLHAYAVTGEHIRAIKFFSAQTNARSPQAYTSLMQACEKAGDFVAARKVFELQMGSLVAAAGAGREKAEPEASSMADGLKISDGSCPEKNFDMVQLASMIANCAKTGDSETALKLLALAEGHQRTSEKANLMKHSPGSSTASNHLHCSSSSSSSPGPPPTSLSVEKNPIPDEKKKNLATTPAAPDLVLYTSTLVACERAGRWEDALEVLQRMRQKQVDHFLPTRRAKAPKTGLSSCFFICIAACEKARKFSHSEDLVREMQHLKLIRTTPGRQLRQQGSEEDHVAETFPWTGIGSSFDKVDTSSCSNNEHLSTAAPLIPAPALFDWEDNSSFDSCANRSTSDGSTGTRTSASWSSSETAFSGGASASRDRLSPRPASGPPSTTKIGARTDRTATSCAQQDHHDVLDQDHLAADADDSRLSFSSEPLVFDLHGLPAAAARAMVRVVIAKECGTGLDLVFVTGRESHSKATTLTKHRLRPALERMLRAELGLSCRALPGNDGRLLVTGASLESRRRQVRRNEEGAAHDHQ
ncbi:unnamed protein product [Amoebophrya sp. A120]|nr:unnamed protein product [Amoebophrya sp. A120]|eukprot:GSA120T00001428001.1